MKSVKMNTTASASARFASGRASRFARGNVGSLAAQTGRRSALAQRTNQARKQRVGGYGLKSRSTCVVTYADASGEQKTIVIGLAADSGCGKSTFMRRVTKLFGGDPEPPKGKSIHAKRR